MLDINVGKIEYFLPTLLILIVMVSISQGNSILAYSPSFYRQHAGEETTNGKYLDSTSYTSDGKTLNATIWLKVSGNQSYNDGLRYGIKIALGNSSDYTYDVYIIHTKRGWMTDAVENAPQFKGSTRHVIAKPLEISRKYTSLYNGNNYTSLYNGSKYINLSLDLDAIGYPDQYNMYSYVENSSGSILDQTYKVNVPPLRCTLYCVIPSWPSVKIFSGKTYDNFSVPIYSNNFIKFTGTANTEQYNVSLNVANGTDTHNITLTFSPPTLLLPIDGSNKYQLHISTPSNIISNNYTMWIDETFIPASGPISAPQPFFHPFNIEVIKRPTLLSLIFTPQYTVLMASTYTSSSQWDRCDSSIFFGSPKSPMSPEYSKVLNLSLF
jgi:hypothetical protein